MTETSKEVVLSEGAARALAEAVSIDELKQLRDQFAVAQAWAKNRGLGVESENKAAEYVLRAERRIGQSLIQLKVAGRLCEGQPSSVGSPDSSRVLLEDLGLTRDSSSNYQRVAVIPDDEFEEMLARARAAKERIAKINFYLAPKGPRDEPETPEDKGFSTFRAGAYHLLGWRVNEDGVGAPTKNGLLLLPNDELVQLADILKALVAAYQATREERSHGSQG